MPEKGLSFSSQNPNTAQLTDQLQNPPKIITGTGAGGWGIFEPPLMVGGVRAKRPVSDISIN